MPPNAAQGASMFSSLLPIILIFVVFYFLLIRPQAKKQKEHQKMLNNLKKGDRVITLSGIYGNVQDIQGNIVKLKISENVNVQILKSAISAVVNENAQNVPVIENK
ncbi:MAG: preprotein translocase subunit YajC [Elusimicrobia bacterium RIFOXYC2_FULL_34_12]|nr:MAG: preprotein translocase subunit YajC [Elusimicrobia bacterium RIFOXYC2_FULL_34_12]OGS38885.1 MAG: preprotein translocase subunit YajC [Elusimicrobia bacterium RIFOXYD2_FULL_34_30]HAM39042.1 preprotein translocase subunit YajC [Elusimicrobiota bacterium]